MNNNSERMEEIKNTLKKELKNSLIRGIMIGYETTNNMIIAYSQNHTADEIREFCEKNIKNKKVMEMNVERKYKDE